MRRAKGEKDIGVGAWALGSLGVKTEPENHQTRGLGDTGENLKHVTRNLEPHPQVGVGVIPEITTES